MYRVSFGFWGGERHDQSCAFSLLKLRLKLRLKLHITVNKMKLRLKLRIICHTLYRPDPCELTAMAVFALITRQTHFSWIRVVLWVPFFRSTRDPSEDVTTLAGLLWATYCAVRVCVNGCMLMETQCSTWRNMAMAHTKRSDDGPEGDVTRRDVREGNHCVAVVCSSRLLCSPMDCLLSDRDFVAVAS